MGVTSDIQDEEFEKNINMEDQKNTPEEMSEQDKKDILSMDEPTSYFLVDECGMFLFRMNHDMADGRIPKESHEGILKDMMR